MQKSKTMKKLVNGITILVFMLVCLCAVTFAMMVMDVDVKNNVFNTGKVEINLNDGNPVIEENEFIFEPGVTVTKEFFVENNSTWDVWYKIYFANIQGELADELEAAIYDGQNEVWSGNIKDLNKVGVIAAEESLAPGQKKNLILKLHLPKVKDNNVQDLRMSFDVLSEAVQTKNNPGKLFN